MGTREIGYTSSRSAKTILRRKLRSRTLPRSYKGAREHLLVGVPPEARETPKSDATDEPGPGEP